MKWRRLTSSLGVVLMANCYIAWTMDCERVINESPLLGPKNEDESEKSITGFVEILEFNDLKATLFFVPDSVNVHKTLIPNIKEHGHEVAMHLHPESFGDGHYNKPLGNYSYEEQRRIISEALKAWTDSVGDHPGTFRPGNCSANNDTYRICKDEGFVGGSFSIPGRNRPELYAVWVNASRWPHRVDFSNKILEGKENFVEVPITSLPGFNVENLPPTGHPFHLRIEYDTGNFHDFEKVISSSLDAQMDQGGDSFLCCVTHNYHPYWDSSSYVRQNMLRLINTIRELTEKKGCKIKPFTIMDTVTRFCK
ncbi:hypothetical protein ES705_11003 [subsurface metagenome]